MKTLNCTDTIRYAQVKQQLLGNPNNFNSIDVWQSDNEAISQTFLLSGSSLSIKGVELFGMNGYSTVPGNVYGTASITVRASIYNVNASNVPTTSVASGTVTLSSTAPNYYYVYFASPVTVTANYAVVIDVTSADGVYTSYVNDPAPNQPYDELLAHCKSSYYSSSNGTFVNVPTYTTSGFTGGPFNFEPLVAPIVSYTINTTATASLNPSCLGTAVTFSGTSTPAAVLSNRMYNYQVFRTYFGTAQSDSTYVWDMDNNSPAKWTASHSYTYPAAGTYNPEYYTLGGFWTSCADFTTLPITINALPTVNAGADVAICAGASTSLTASGASTYSWNNGLGAGTTHSVTPTTTTTYNATGTGANGCVNTDQVIVTVNALPVVNAGADVTICAGTSTSLTASGASTYSWNNGLGAGATHSVTPAATTTYTATGTSASGCVNTDQVTVTVTPLQNASFSYTANTICSGSSNVTPTATVAGTFTSSPAGLVINASTGEINVAGSTEGTYTITHTVTAASCTNTATQTVTITGVPEADFSFASASYCASVSNPLPTFSGTASAGVFSSTTGLSINSSTGEINVATSTPGTYTITNSIAASGSCPATSATATVTILGLPTAVISGGGSICGTETENLTITLTGTAPFDFTYTDGTTPVIVTGHTSNTYTIAASAGIYTVTAVEDASCSNTGSGTATVTLFPNPMVTLSTFTAVCNNAAPVTLTQGTPAGGTYSGTGVTAGTFDPAAAASGTVITYSYTDANGCSASAPIAVEAAPVVTFIALATVCSDAAPFALSGATPAGGTYSGAGVTAGNFNPATAGVGTHSIVYSYTASNTCSATATQSIVVENCAGIAESELAGNLAIYPNPANGSVFVSFHSTEATSAAITLISNDGKIISANRIAQANEFNQEISLAHLASGIYTIQIQTQNGSATKKLIVQ